METSHHTSKFVVVVLEGFVASAREHRSTGLFAAVMCSGKDGQFFLRRTSFTPCAFFSSPPLLGCTGSGLRQLRPYAREFDNAVKHEIPGRDSRSHART